MKKKILTSLVMGCLVITVGITACNSFEQENNTKENNQQQEREVLNRENFKSFYIEGNYDEELYKTQNSLSEDETYYKIIESKSAFDKEVEKYNLKTPRMEYSLNYNKEYFEDKALLLVYPGQGSSSVSYYVKEVKEYNDGVDVLIERHKPDEGTTDMVNHGLLIEIHKKSVDKPINIDIQIATTQEEE